MLDLVLLRIIILGSCKHRLEHSLLFLKFIQGLLVLVLGKDGQHTLQMSEVGLDVLDGGTRPLLG